jgi:hypothetical protein
MSDSAQDFWDILTEAEALSAQAIMRELAPEAWTRPLLAAIDDNGGLIRANKSLLFELRFAAALRNAGLAPQYEVAGEGQSTLDFAFRSGNSDWLVELMRLEETDAARNATGAGTDEDGILWSGRILRTNADDSRQSEEGETLKAVQRICQKCERGGRSHKFPPPGSAYHVLLVDFRTFLHGGDIHDRIHVGLGGEFLENELLRRRWNGELISGAYSPRTNVRGAREFRERVHFLGFVQERTHRAGEFAAVTQFIANPHLFRDAAEVNAAMADWPLQPVHILNGG